MAMRYILAHSVPQSGAFKRIGEIYRFIGGRTINRAIRQGGTAQFTIDYRDPMASEVYELDLRLVLIYQDGILRFVGRIVTIEERPEGIAVTTADAFWGAKKAFIYTGNPATPFYLATSTSYKGAVMYDMVERANSPAAMGFTATYAGPESGEGQIQNFGPVNFMKVSEGIQQMASQIDAPEWVLNPIEPVNVFSGTGTPVGGAFNWIKFGEMQIKMVVGGVVRDSFSFDFGWGAFNVSTYTRTRTAENLAMKAYSLPTPQVPFPMLSSWDYNNQVSRGFYNYQEVVPTPDGPSSLIQEILNEHARLRKLPQEIITFTPISDQAGPRVPKFGVDYNLGDIVPFRAYVNGVFRINANFRVYGIQLTVDESGAVSTALTLVPNAD